MNAQATQATQATTVKANVKGNNTPVQAALVQDAPIIPVTQETAVSTANVPFPTILYPRLDNKGEARKQKPYIYTESRTIHARIGGVTLSMVMPESDTIGIHDMVQCRATKVSGVYSVDAEPFSVPAVIFFASGLAGMAGRINTNAEKRTTFDDMLVAWAGCYPTPSDEKACNVRPAFTWGSFIATYQPTEGQLQVWTALRGKTTTELTKLTKGLRERCEWLRDAMDAAGYVEPIQVAIPDDLAALLG